MTDEKNSLHGARTDTLLGASRENLKQTGRLFENLEQM